MRILVLTERFAPEITAPSVRVMDHAHVWRELGHEVTVVTCAPNFPHGRLFDGYRNLAYQTEEVDGVSVIRVWSYLAANAGVFRRAFDYLSFMLSSVAWTFRYPRFDVLIATSPPISTAVAGWLIASARRRPWVFEVRDLWPASIKAVGVADGWWISLLERLEIFLYGRSSRVIVLTRSFLRDLVSRGVPEEKIALAFNGVDADRFDPDAVDFDARAELKIGKDVFLAGYVGTTGMAHGLETLLDAAEKTLDHERLRWLIIGEGAERERLEREAQRRGLENLLFRDFVPHDRVPAYLAALDVSVVHLRPDPLFETVIPSKIFESMAMGVPIVLGVRGEAADIVGSSAAGICVSPGDAEAMAEAVTRLASDADLHRKLASAGRRAARERWGRRSNAESALEALRAVTQGQGGGP